MKPLIIADRNIPFLEGRLEDVASMVYAGQDEFSRELVRDADALLVRTRTRCDAALLEGSRVSLVATATIGTDHVDGLWCRANGIEVSSAPGCNAPGVAQYVWSALHNLGFRPERGMKLGVVGCGNIGGIVADWGRRLGTEVRVSDPPKQRAGITDNYHTLDDILRHCDAVTLHTPITRQGPDATFHLIDADRLALMRPGAILINAARGPVVDNAALRRHLEEGSGLRTVLDTWEGEPAIDTRLLDLVDIGTFHIAGYSSEGKQRATRMVIEAVERHFNITGDKTGLEGPYEPADTRDISLRGIADSYDISADSVLLKRNPDLFDHLRNNYRFRHEYGKL